MELAEFYYSGHKFKINYLQPSSGYLAHKIILISFRAEGDDSFEACDWSVVTHQKLTFVDFEVQLPLICLLGFMFIVVI